MPKSKRDWKRYNEQLVRRGELLLELDFVKKWEKELEEMNRGKRGKPFAYPESLVKFLGFLRLFFKLPFRQKEGFVEALGRFVPGLEAPNYSTICRRITPSRPSLRTAWTGWGTMSSSPLTPRASR